MNDGVDFICIIVGVVLGYWVRLVAVPFATEVLGEDNFVEANAMGFGLIIFGLLLGLAFPGVLRYFHWSPWWSLPLTAIVLTCMAVVYLFLLAPGDGRQWKVEDGRVLKIEENVEIKPQYVRQASDYTETTAFNGYTVYLLELGAEAEVLAQNVYRSEAQKNEDLAALFVACPECRSLDLILVCFMEDRVWISVSFSNDWTDWLCGSMEPLPEASRYWWRQWLRPQFAPNPKVRIDVDDWLIHLAELKAVHRAFQPGSIEDDWVARHTMGGLFAEARKHNKSVFAMTRDSYNNLAKSRCGGRVIFTYDPETGREVLRPG